MKTIEDIKRDIAANREQMRHSTTTKAEYNRLSKQVERYTLLAAYLEANPTEESLLKQAAALQHKIKKCEREYSMQFGDRAAPSHKRWWEKEKGILKLREQLENIEILLG